MKSRIPLLLILSILALGLTSLNAQETTKPQTAPPGSLTKYGFVVGKLYLGEVADLYVDTAIKASEPFIVTQLSETWNDGYKQGALDYGPESARWEATAWVWRGEAEKAGAGPIWGTVWIAGAGGLVVGFGAGVLAVTVIFAAVR